MKKNLTLLLAFLSSSPAWNVCAQDDNSFVRSTEGSGLLTEKLLVVSDTPDFMWHEKSNVPENTHLPKPFTLFWRLKAGTDGKEKEGYYLAGNSLGEPLGWINTKDVVSWNNRCVLRPIRESSTDAAFEVFETVSATAPMTAFQGIRGKIPKGYVRIALLRGRSRTSVGGACFPLNCVTVRVSDGDAKIASEGVRDLKLEIAFVVGTTGDAQPLVSFACQALESLQRYLAELKLDDAVRFALVEYRDDGEEFVTRVQFPLSHDMAGFSRSLSSLNCAGGGDERDAVHAGLEVALTELEWTDNSSKHVVLLGTSPPKHALESDLNGLLRLANPAGNGPGEATKRVVSLHAVAGHMGHLPLSVEQSYRRLCDGRGYFGEFSFQSQESYRNTFDAFVTVFTEGVRLLASIRSDGKLPEGYLLSADAFTEETLPGKMDDACMPKALDIVLVLGATGGAHPLVNLAQQLVRRTTGKESGVKDVRFGVFVYQDEGDALSTSMSLPLTPEVEAIVSALDDIECKGAGMHKGGLSSAIRAVVGNCAWRQQAAKHVIVFADEADPEPIELKPLLNNSVLESPPLIHAVGGYQTGPSDALEVQLKHFVTGALSTLNYRDEASTGRVVEELSWKLRRAGPSKLPESHPNPVAESLQKLYLRSDFAGDRKTYSGFGRVIDCEGRRVSNPAVLMTRTEVMRLWNDLQELKKALLQIQGGSGDVKQFTIAAKRSLVSALTGDLASRHSEAELETIIEKDLPFPTSLTLVSMGQVAIMEDREFDAMLASITAAEKQITMIYDSPEKWFSSNAQANQKWTLIPYTCFP